MKVAKITLAAFAGLIGLALLAAAILPNDYAVEREVTIERPKEDVFAYVKFLKNQDTYSKWANMDPAMKKSYRGTDGTIGFVSAWDSKNEDVGKGEQEIVAIEEGKRIDYELRFLAPFEATSPAYMTTEAVTGNQTQVRWGMSGRMGFPMNLMIPLMNMEEMIANDLDSGLVKLKELMESEPALATSEN